MVWFPFLLAVLTLLSYSGTGVSGCSNFLMENKYMLSGRTMDLGSLPLHADFSLQSSPAGQTLPHGAGNSRYGFVGFIPSDGPVELSAFVTGGLNERGLSCDVQTLLGTEYPEKSNATGVLNIGASQMCKWVLGEFSTAAELKQVLLNGTAQVFEDLVTKAVGGQHFSVRDASGASIVIEFVRAQTNVYDDLNDGKTGFGLMTNEPEYPWHVQNVKHFQWKQQLARPATDIPGAFYPDLRFLRLHLLKSVMPPPTDYQSAVAQAVHVLNSVTVPMGNQMGTDSGAGEGKGDHTLWGVVYDHTNQVLYFRGTDNQSLQRVQLSDLKLGSGASKWTVKVNGSKRPFFVDVVASAAV